MAGGEMITVATLMATSQGMHSYYNKDAVTVGMKAGKIGVIAGKIGMKAGKVGVVAGIIGEKEGMMAAKTSMDATYVEYNGVNYMIPVGTEVMYTTGNVFAGYKMADGTIMSAATLEAAATSSMHSYYDKTVGKTVGKIVTVGKTVGKIATPTVGKTVGKIATPTVGVVGTKAGIAAAKVGMVAGGGVTYTSEDDTYVMYQGHKFMIPTGAHIMYDSGNQFAGYMMTGGQ